LCVRIRFLSVSKTIKGKLHLEDVDCILIDHVLVNELRMQHDDGEILNFEIEGFKVTLLVEWTDYPPKKRLRKTEFIEIEAKKIYWENSC
jgi:hypothetical protein